MNKHEERFREKRYSVIAEFKDGHITGYESMTSFFLDISQEKNKVLRAEIDLEHKLSFDDFFCRQPMRHLLG